VTRISIVLVALLSSVQPGAAQGVSLKPTDQKRWDFGVNVGWLGGNKTELADHWNQWYETFATTVDAGYYWTPNFKTETSVGYTTEGDVYTQEQITLPGPQAPIFFSREHSFGLTAVRLGASYQFFENSWVHPFVTGGAQIAWERHTVETPFPFISGRDPQSRFPIPELDAPPRTQFSAHPFVGAGAKFYVNERGFIRTDLSTALDGRGATHVTWRVGAGVDF
jgi:hypothetical protein